MTGNPVGWFEIYVQDMERARTFYEGVLQVRLEKLESPGSDPIEMWSFPMQKDAAGAAGALVKMDGVGSGGLGTTVYFVCEDCSVEAGRAEANGGSVMKSKTDIGPYGFFAHVKDPDGNIVGLHSMR